jgi:hypothetical protein
MMDLKSAPFPDCLRLANVVLLPPIVRFGEMTCISFDAINFTGGKERNTTLFHPPFHFSHSGGGNNWSAPASVNRRQLHNYDL